jgi:hypothetical protein
LQDTKAFANIFQFKDRRAVQYKAPSVES